MGNRLKRRPVACQTALAIAGATPTGGVRNHDVLARGHAKVGPVVLGVEGKVNESLDLTIAGKYAAAAARRAKGQNTNLDRRVDALLDAFAGRRVTDDPALGALRYQLFSGLAGTLAAAPAAKAAVFVVHLIRTPLARLSKFEESRAAVADFVSTVFGQSMTGNVAGPLAPRRATALMPADVPLWVAILETPGSSATVPGDAL